MPIHDWTRVGDGMFHAFHVSWVSEIQEALNDGLLPPTYYAQAEQIAGPLGPDVLTLQTNGYPPAKEDPRRAGPAGSRSPRPPTRSAGLRRDG
ncbi:MAG: hypothetical protein U0797_03380 [Gemmataceae bacterium]